MSVVGGTLSLLLGLLRLPRGRARRKKMQKSVPGRNKLAGAAHPHLTLPGPDT